MSTKIKLVLAAVLVLGASSLAQASNENDGGNETGGYVLPGNLRNLDGINPAYHPRWFPNYGRVMRAYDRANSNIYSGGYLPNPTSAYASARALAKHIHHSQR
jgi:hypothetical protein